MAGHFGGIPWSELFPNRNSALIFIGYMSLFISQGILVTSSQDSNNKYNYNTVTVVLLTEFVKLFVSICLYCRDKTFVSLVATVSEKRIVLGLYFVPALLYCLYNNLAFVNLSAFDPTTYYLLLQFRVVITGILFQVIFKKYLSRKQWFSLILLTIGCMLKQTSFGVPETNTANDIKSATNQSSFSDWSLSINAVYILVQTVCSCLAGVYNEYLLKDKGSDVNIYVQNVFMYLDSIVCNIVLLTVQGHIWDAFSVNNFSLIFRPSIILIILNNTGIGIVTSFFLKYLNSILKTFASALELVFTAILCYILFAIPIYLNTILAIGIVSLAIYIYSQSPVVNLGTKNQIRTSTDDDTKKLLVEDV